MHNILKKNIGNSDYIKFLRMPIISFGTSDRDMQVLDLLIREAPINNYDLANVYEEKYGVQKNTVAANFFKCIEQHYYNGEFRIDTEELTNEEYNFLEHLLTKDVYEIGFVKKMFEEKFSKISLAKINSYNFKRLGYKISKEIIYSSKNFNSGESFFKDYLSNRSIIDLTEEKWLVKNQTFYGVLNQYRYDYELIEFFPYKYISINKLKEHGVDKQNLISFCKAACDFVNGKYFTIFSLKKSGFDDNLFDLGFDNFFYSSLLKFYRDCQYHKVDNTLLFKEGVDKVLISNLIQDIVYDNGGINIYELIDYINDKYGIRLEKSNLAKYADDAELYFSSTMEKIYIDYNQFYEEV